MLGRESPYYSALAPYLSEGALHVNRMFVMLVGLEIMAEQGLCRPLTQTEQRKIRLLKDTLGRAEAERAAYFDHFAPAPLEHDLKACEYVLREKLAETTLADLVEYLYFCYTSEDINNLAYNRMLSLALDRVWIPALLKMMDAIASLAREYRDLPCMSLTHGQPATPTTMGKRFAEFLSRLTDTIIAIREIRLDGKCSGSVGNYNSATLVCPDFDYVRFARTLVERLGFEFQPIANQRNNHVRVTRLFHLIGEANTIISDFATAMWLLIKDGYLVQKVITSEVGSSVMPQKCNPWRSELIIGYAQMCNAMISSMQMGMIPTFYERILSDHCFERFYGVILSLSLTILNYAKLSLDRVTVNQTKIAADLAMHPEVLAEAINVAGRMLRVPDAYVRVKDLIRNGVPHRQVIEQVLPVSPIRDKLLTMEPQDFIGIAPELVDQVLAGYDACKSSSRIALTTQPREIVYVFDFDNTLVDTKTFITAHLIDTCQTLGVEPPTAVQIDKILVQNLPFDNMFGQWFDPQTASNVLAAYRSTAMMRSYNPCRGLYNLLQKLDGKGVFVILTNRIFGIRERLKQSGLNPNLFAHIVSPAVKKPALEAFDEIRELCPWSQLVFIGDHPDDWRATRNTSIQFYAVLTGLSSRQDFIDAGLDDNRIVDNLAQLNL